MNTHAHATSASENFRFVRRNQKPFPFPFDPTGRNAILNGDSATVMKTIPSASINLVLTSPPYTTSTNIPRQNSDYCAQFDFDTIAQELVRVMAPGAFLLLNEDAMVEKDGPNKGGRSLDPYRHVIKLVELGLVRHQTIIWSKSQARYPDRHRNSHAYETIEVFFKPPFDPKRITVLRDRPNKCAGMPVRYNVRHVDGTLTRVKSKHAVADFGKRTDIWQYSPGAGKSYDRPYLSKHPALMHMGLVADLIRSFVRPVQADGSPSVVLDPFGGGFTTANEAIKQGMCAISIEMSPNYCALGKRRLDETLQELGIKPVESTSVSKSSPPIKEITMKSIDLTELPALKQADALPASDIMSLTQIANLGCMDIPAVVEGLIPAQSVTIIGGASGSKKTWAAIDLALEVARGGIWLGKWSTRKARVLYVDLELSQNALGKRVRNLCIGKGMAMEGADIVFKSNGAINLKDQRCLEELSAAIRQHKPGVVILDPLISAADSFAENQAGSVAKVFKVLKALADEHQIAIVVVDHHSKGKVKELRGSSAKKGYADTVISITKTASGKSELLVTKNRHWSEEDQPMFFELTAQGCPQEGLRLRVVEQGDESAIPQAQLIGGLNALILGKLTTGLPTYRKELVAVGHQHGYSIKEVDAALHDLETSGQVVKQRDSQAKGRGNRAHVYFLVSQEVSYQEAA